MNMIEKPWGTEFIVYENEDVAFKILKVNNLQSTSLQYHKKKNECWLVTKGNPLITIGSEYIHAKPGDVFKLKKMTLHRIWAKNGDCEVAEIRKGKDSDIKRLEDQYGRS